MPTEKQSSVLPSIINLINISNIHQSYYNYIKSFLIFLKLLLNSHKISHKNE